MTDLSELLVRCEPSVASLDVATTLPPEVFVDPAWFDAERKVAHAGWVAVARSVDVAERGAFVCAEVFGEPVIVVRARDGVLRALSNVCRHRSMVMLEGSGVASALQCPYHLWTYRLDGRLGAAPSMEAATGFEVGEVCLPEFAVVEWHGWVLVNIDRTAVDPAVAMPTLDSLLAEERVGEMVSVGTISSPADWNWKVSVENFLESYHHRGVHPATLDTTFPGHRSFASDPSGEPWAAVDHVSTAEGAEPFIAITVFPTLVFAVVRGVGLTWFRLEPVSELASALTIDVLVLPEFAHDAALGEMLVSSTRAINDEDVPINQRTMVGLRSRFAAQGRISNLEAATWHFRRWLVESVRQTTGR
jgi:phenylpropionate dioxygenase-like ring-hydroxylating dioxygenase large terminal subunit